MIYSNFTGRVAKQAKVIDGVNGQFLSMDMAVNDYSKGEETTQWVRVQSSDPAHLKLVEYAEQRPGTSEAGGVFYQGTHPDHSGQRED